MLRYKIKTTILISFSVYLLASNSYLIAKERVLEIPLNKGMLFSLINPKNNPSEEAKEKLKIYYDKALPLAREYGYKSHGPLRVSEKLAGNRDLSLLIAATWPSENADFTFEGLEQWQKYKDMRPAIWDELNFYKAVNEKTKTLRFSENKFYTIAFAYFDDKFPNDYQTYMEGIQSAVAQAGGKFIHKMSQPRFVSHTPSLSAPNEINIVEWDSYDGLAKFQKSEGFLDYAHFLNSGTEKFELYRIAPVFR